MASLEFTTLGPTTDTPMLLLRLPRACLLLDACLWWKRHPDTDNNVLGPGFC